jgi:hypothetical protein
MLHAMNDDAEGDNDIDDNNLDAKHYDVEVDDDDNLDADHDHDAQLHFHSINDIIVMVRFEPRALVVEDLHVVRFDEPTYFTEAERNPSWRKVMMEEMTSIE